LPRFCQRSARARWAAAAAVAALLAWGLPHAWQAWRERQWAGASIVELEETIRQSPRDARAQFYLGEALQRSGQAREAADAYREAARLDPTSPDAPVRLATILVDAGADAEARDLLLSVVHYHPRHAEAHRLLGQIYQARGFYQYAAGHYALATRLRPDDADAWAGLGVCAARNSEPTRALSALRRAVALRPHQAVFLRALGRAEAQFGELELAAAHLRQATALDPTSAVGQYELGRVLAGRDDTQREAEAALQRAIALANLPDARFELGLLLESTGRPADAAPELESVLRREPHHYAARNALARVYLRLGRREEARAQWAIFRRQVTASRLLSNLRHRLELSPNDATLHRRLARALAETGDADGARQEERAARRLQSAGPAAERE
jgi:tetratricopeptide (TPR) repeat protein